MKILRKDTDLNILLNTETDFQTNLGWEESLKEFETEVLNDIINPIENYETVRYIHKPYLSDGVEQTDIWFYFYFQSGGTYVQDYTPQGISSQENENMLKQATESFFRLEFYKTPGIISGTTLVCEPPTRQNRKLIFSKNLSLPLGEKMFYNPLNGFIHLPVFRGSNYSNKENMYFFWFQDESVLTETNLSGTTTSNTFFMTAKFYNAKDGTILDFANDCYSTSHTIIEQNDMYYQVDINKRDYSYQVYFYNGVVKCEEVGLTNKPIMFFERGGGTAPSNILYHICSNVTPTPTITPTPTRTPSLTPTPTPTPTITPTPTQSDGSYLLVSSSSRSSACNEYETGTKVKYWIMNGGGLQTGNVLCQNNNCSTKAIVGFYSDGTNYYEVGYGGTGTIISQGLCSTIGITTIGLSGSATCRTVGSCNDNATCGVRIPILFNNGRPSATQITATVTSSQGGASISIYNDLGDNTDCFVSYSETSGLGTIAFTLTLKTFPGGEYICDSGMINLSHNNGGQPWSMLSNCS
jgi:hypothetical protein